MLLSTYQNRSKIIKKVIFWAIVVGGLCALLFTQTMAGAQSAPIDPCDPNSGLGGCLGGISQFNNNQSRANNITDFVLLIIRFLIYVGAAISVLFIVIGGYYMLTSNGDADKYKKGLNTLVYAVIGFVISIVSVTIIALLGSFLTSLNITTPTRN